MSIFRWLLASTILTIPALACADGPRAATEAPQQAATAEAAKSSPARAAVKSLPADPTRVRVPGTGPESSLVEMRIRSVTEGSDEVAPAQHSAPVPPAPTPAGDGEPQRLEPISPAPSPSDHLGFSEPPAAVPSAPRLPIPADPQAAADATGPLSAYPGPGLNLPSHSDPNPHVGLYARGCPHCGRRHGCGRPICCGERYAGWHLHRAMNAQIGNALANQLVLYHYDFEQDDPATQLSHRGERQLAKYAPRALILGRPIIIEPTPGRPGVDDARRDNVIQALTQLDPSAADLWGDGQHVVVARPKEPGLSGREALHIDDNLMKRTQSGTPLESSSGGISGGGQGSSMPLPMF